MSQSIRALRFADKERVSVVDAQVPDPGPGEILLDVKAAGLCGSDLHYFHMTHEEMQHATQPRSPEMTPGHEIAGVVLSVGPGVNYPAVGDRGAAAPKHRKHVRPVQLLVQTSALPDSVGDERASGRRPRRERGAPFVGTGQAALPSQRQPAMRRSQHDDA